MIETQSCLLSFYQTCISRGRLVDSIVKDERHKKSKENQVEEKVKADCETTTHLNSFLFWPSNLCNSFRGRSWRGEEDSLLHKTTEGRIQIFHALNKLSIYHASYQQLTKQKNHSKDGIPVQSAHDALKKGNTYQECNQVSLGWEYKQSWSWVEDRTSISEYLVPGVACGPWSLCH